MTDLCRELRKQNDCGKVLNVQVSLMLLCAFSKLKRKVRNNLGLLRHLSIWNKIMFKNTWNSVQTTSWQIGAFSHLSVCLLFKLLTPLHNVDVIPYVTICTR